MIKRISTAILTVLFSTQVFASGVVTDPGSYVYYVEQIAKLETQIEQAITTAEKTTVSAEKLTQMKDQLEGVYNRIVGLPDRLAKQAARLEQVPNYLETDVAKIEERLGTNRGQLAGGGDMSEWESLDLHIDGVFGDPRDPNWNPWKLNEQRYEVRQGIMRNSLKRSTLRLHGLKDRMKELNKLFGEIDRTKNIKDSQDLNNRLVAELLVGQQEMIELLAHMAQAAAVMGYKGMNANGSQARATLHEKNRKAGKKGPSTKERLMSDMGVSADMTINEYEQRMTK